MLFVTEDYTLVLTTRFVHFKHGMTRTGSSNISPSTSISRTI